MIQILCFFMPACIATWAFEKRTENKLNIKELIFVYAIFVGIINVVCLTVITVVFQHPHYIINSQIFSVAFSLKYILLSLFVAAILLASYGIFQKCRQNKANFYIKNNERIRLSLIINFFFVFTTLIFIPCDIFFANSSDFLFSFSDFWWIMLSFAFVFLIILTIVSMVIPQKIFVFIESIIFSLTFLCYIQRMFLNFYITSLVGEKLNTSEHPLWSLVNLLIWLSLIAGIPFLFYIRRGLWKNILYLVSIGLIIVQGVAFISLLITEDLFGSEHLTTEGLYELATDNNIFVFVLDYYDFSFIDIIKENEPDFFDSLEGFTYFDNTASVYSRSYPSNTYLMTGVELNEFHINPYKECVDMAFEKSAFLPDLKNLGFEIDVYTYENYVGKAGKPLIRNYSNEKYHLAYWGTIAGVLKCSLYFEMPYLAKPFFWVYEINTMVAKGNQYVVDDAKLYADLIDNRLMISDSKSMYKYIHMHGAHFPYTLDENGNRVPEGVKAIQQWKGSMKIVYEYLEQMKVLGKYDSATIVITTDHGSMNGTGDLNSAVGPIMFVKPAHAPSQNLAISHTPISHSDIFSTIIEAAGGNYSMYGDPIFSISEEDRSRVFHYTRMIDWDEKDVVDYEIPQNIRDFDNWTVISTKKVLKSAYPVYK